MNLGDDTILVISNQAEIPKSRMGFKRKLNLEYRSKDKEKENVKLKLPNFVRQVNYLPERILDLLEIASYIFAADRSTNRGAKNLLEYHSWSRSFLFIIKVRDYEFWKRDSVKRSLSKALQFMSGDKEYTFEFQPGHTTPITGLFDREEFRIEPKENVSIILFSGGLDSLCGTLERLRDTEDQICLISHRSNQPGIARTQDRLFESLALDYPRRLHHYKFYCSLKNVRAKEESQRTRSFLYTAIAFALSQGLSQNKFYIYENGITSLNLIRREDMINARNSRTTHPKTIKLLSDFYAEFESPNVEICNPFLFKTKTDILRSLKNLGKQKLISSSVSCSKIFNAGRGGRTHCGGCFQCIDRRLTAYAAELEDYDGECLYNLDFIKDCIHDKESRTTLIDYLRQAINFCRWNIDEFYLENLNELTNIEEYFQDFEEEKILESVFKLCEEHGKQILYAIKRIHNIHEDLLREIPKGSLLDIVKGRAYLKQPVLILVEEISEVLSSAIPIAFQSIPPKNEEDLNDKMHALLSGYKEKYEREFPAISFACTKTIPDHALNDYELLIEAKYIRGKTTTSKVTDGIAADLIKYPIESYKLFVVYDPFRSIIDDDKFQKDFEGKGNCKILIIR
jgi:hypothetical protein